MISDILSKESVDSYFEAWKTNDKDLFLSVFSDDAIWEDPIGSPPHSGKAQIGEFWDQAHSDPNGTLNPKINRSVFIGNEAMVSFTMEVRGQSGGMNLEVTDFFKVNSDGKIILARAFWDASCITPVL